MLHLGKGVGDSTPYPLGRGIGRRESRVLFFEGLQLAEQAIVFGVRDLRIVEHVVPVIVRPDPFGENLVTRRCV